MRNRLQSFAFLSIVMGCYPVFLLLTSLFRLQTEMAWYLTLLSVVSVFVSRLLRCAVSRPERRSRILGIAAATAGSLLWGAAVSLCASLLTEKRAAMLFGICAAAVCFIVWKSRNLHHHQLIGNGSFLVLAALHFLVLLYMSIRNEEALQGCCLSMLLFSAAYGCLRCMSSLAAASPSQTSSAAVSHNARIYAVYAAIGLLPLLFGKYAVQLIRSGIRMIGKNILSFLRWLSSLTGSESGFSSSEQVVQPVQGEGQDDLRALFVIEILCLILILLLVFRMRHRIAAWLSRIFRAAVQTVRHLFHGAQEMPSPEDGMQEYSDYIESIPIADSPRKIRENPVRGWRKQYHQFRKTSDETARFRLGYGLWTSALMLRGAKLAPADTPDEICSKAEDFDDPTMSRAVTQAYYHVRYGERAPEVSAMESLDTLLAHNASVLRSRK